MSEGLTFFTIRFDPDEVKAEYRNLYINAVRILMPKYRSIAVLCKALEGAKANWSLDIAHLHITEWYGEPLNEEYVRTMRGDDFLATFSQTITQ